MRATAWLIGHRLDGQVLDQYDTVGVSPRVVQVRTDGFVVLFRFGAAVFFALTEEEELLLLEQLGGSLSEVYAEPEHEGAEITIDPNRLERVESSGEIVLHEVSTDRLQVVAQVLAKSTLLAYYEQRVADVFVRVEELAVQLKQGGRVARNRDLLRDIGDVLLIQARTVGRAEVSDKPEITWEYPDLDRLYERLSQEYELRERDLALTRKLEVIANTAETYLDLLRSRQSLRVEWYIVILIVVEIVLSLYEMFIAH